MSAQIVLNQISLACIDLLQTEKWFREGLGLAPAGGTRLKSGTPFTDDILSAPPADAICWRMTAANSSIWIALLQFSIPLPRLQPADFRPCDIGYTRIGVHVRDFDQTLADLAKLGSEPIGPIVGATGERHVCVRNPDGVFVEIMERDPLPDAPRADRESPVALRSVTVSTPDLAATVAYFTALLNEAPADIRLHSDAHEALWKLDAAKCQRATFHSGEMIVEVVAYADPVGKPRPQDYRVSDQSIFSLGVGAQTVADYESAQRRIMDIHAQVSASVKTPSKRALYLHDALGFRTEITWAKNGVSRDALPAADSTRPKPAQYKVLSSVLINAPIERVWAALNDHERMHHWIGADQFEVTKHGSPYSAGYGAERILTTLGRNVLQQVVRVIPGHIGYRAIAGTPFNYHNGTVDVRASGRRTRVDWTIRFRTLPPELGVMVRDQLRQGIPHMLHLLKEMVEAEGHT